MFSIGNPSIAFGSDELSARHLLDALAREPERQLIFRYGGRAIGTGYHLTEVKTGRFVALDCGANPEVWTETFIQLWDVDEPPHAHMLSGKFLAIIGKVAELVPFEPDTKLTFEISDGVGAIQLFRAVDVSVANNDFVVSLKSRPASCKPRDRWLAEQRDSCCSEPACCAPRVA